MKKILPFLAILVLLAACTPGQQVSDADMSTRVAQILTSYPTETIDPNLAPSPLPLEPFSTQPPILEPTLTASPPPTGTPTKTLEPTITETATPEPTGTPAGPTVTQTAPPAPAFTAPATDPIGKLGSPASLDPMDSAATWNWTIGPSQYNTMEFKDGAMLMTATSDISGWRLAGTESLGNVYIEMAARLDKCSGSDNYGIIFRVPALKEADRGYLFGFTCDGRYYLKMWDGKVAPEGKMTTLINYKKSSAIQPGSGVFNRMGVMAIGNRLILYANGALLEEYRDNTFASGYFGVFLNQDITPNLTLRVDQMSYWKDPAP
ncbi:MAG: hypothetical protein IT308_00680 [Anaerolineaceae bacterium]|nr:hypothetical protein [Anaerolineaceae bacterium]